MHDHLVKLTHYAKTVGVMGLLVCGLLPWNATAVNQSVLSEYTSVGSNAVERLLAESLLQISQGNLPQALQEINRLIERVPNFKLAYLVRGDLLMARAKQLEAFGSRSENEAESVDQLREEAVVRIERYLEKRPENKLPNVLWQLNSQQKFAIVVNTAKSRLYVYQNNQGNLEYVTDFYVTIGKNGAGKLKEGDKRTPLGVYFSQIKLKDPLPDLYGNGAYPLNFPNELDRHLNVTGSGIWLHGTPSDTFSRPPRASDGCVVISNADLKALEPILTMGDVPVIITNQFEWLSHDALSENQTLLAEAIEDWKNDWQSQNTDQYLKHYSKHFFNQSMNFDIWAREKRRIQASKPKVQIKLLNTSMLEYPSERGKLVVVTFDQHFKSDVIDNKIRKRQYWHQENGNWKIIYEGAV